jgi:hypothetical protein
MVRGVSGDLRKSHLCTGGLLEALWPDCTGGASERASGRAGTEIKAAISFDFLAVNSG